MQVLIYMSQIAGIASEGTDPATLPSGFTLADAPEAPLEQLYYDGTQVQVRPPKPSPTAIWFHGVNEWREPEIIEYVPEPDWVALVSRLRGTPVWAKCYAAAQAKNKTSVAFALLMVTLTVTRNMDDLRFALGDLLANSPTLFTNSDLEWLRVQMEETYFDPQSIPELAFGSLQEPITP